MLLHTNLSRLHFDTFVGDFSRLMLKPNCLHPVLTKNENFTSDGEYATEISPKSYLNILAADRLDQ
jgi:hypothetical protein